MPSKALRSERVVMENVPLCVVGDPSYIYCTLRAVVCVRAALRSIFRLRTGSRVMRTCRSSVLLVEAGVAIESLSNSHPRSRALSTYESPVRPKAKSRPYAHAPWLRFCPKASPTLGMNPGSDIEYWFE